jgi:oligosaccharyltransferase complex subunit beta
MKFFYLFTGYALAGSVLLLKDDTPMDKFKAFLEAHHTVEVSSKVPDLFSFGERIYDSVIVLKDVSSFKGTLEVGRLLDFVNDGGNVLLAASEKVTDAVRDFAIEFSVEFDEAGTRVFDAFNQKDEYIIPNVIQNLKVFSKPISPLLYKGIAHKVSGKNNLVFSLLNGSPSSYSYAVDDKDWINGNPMLGNEVGLVSVMQARNNARVGFIGSIDFFTDK